MTSDARLSDDDSDLEVERNDIDADTRLHKQVCHCGGFAVFYSLVLLV